MTIRDTLLTVTLLLSGWLCVLVGVTLFSDDAPAALVLFPSEDFLEQVPEDVAVVAASPFSVTLTSEDTDFARQLYRQGAWLVLPAGLQGCGALRFM